MALATDMARSRQVELILASVDSLPTLSPIATRLLSLGSSDEVDIDEISKIIEADVAMASRVLSMCRRADKGLGDRITTVKRAIVMLGIEAIRAAALSVSIYDVLEQGDTKLDSAFDRQGFWRFSIATACACEAIAGKFFTGRVKPDEAFVAGLLHCLGKPVLDHVLPKSYAKVIALAERQGSESAPLERSLVGVDHHTAGKRVAEHWKLPEALREVMWLYGQPWAALPNSGNKELVGVATLGRAVCRALHVGWSGDFGPGPDVSRLCVEMGIVDRQGRPLLREEDLAKTIHDGLADRLAAMGVEETSSPELVMRSLVAANRTLARVNATLDSRARLSQAQGRALEAIVSFSRHAGPRTVTEVFGEVVKSAAGITGEGFFAMLFQARESEEWQLTQFSGVGQVQRSEVVEPPGRDEQSRSLARLADATQMSVASMALLPWIADYVSDSADMRKVKLFPILSDPTKQGGPAAVMLSDRDLAETLGTGSSLHALTATWAAAVAAATRHEEVRRLGESLAESNRTLLETQTKLTEAQALAKLGEITAGAAHEMNNPLTIISGQAQLLATRLRDLKDRTAAERIVTAAEDLSGLITSLHVIASPPRALPQDCELGRIVSDAMGLAAQRLGRVPTAQADISGGVTRVRVDPGLVSRALSELIVNAAEADPKGTVVVRVEADAMTGEMVLRRRTPSTRSSVTSPPAEGAGWASRAPRAASKRSTAVSHWRTPRVAAHWPLLRFPRVVQPHVWFLLRMMKRMRLRYRPPQPSAQDQCGPRDNTMSPLQCQER
jgi:HD-like signal output (HDOD) protein/signal transduction histidine kinase